MPDLEDGIDDFMDDIKTFHMKSGKVRDAITTATEEASAGIGQDPVGRVREELNLRNRPKPMPLIEVETEEEATEAMEEGYPNPEWLEADLADFLGL